MRAPVRSASWQERQISRGVRSDALLVPSNRRHSLMLQERTWGPPPARQQPAMHAGRQAQRPRCARVWHLTVALHEAGMRLPRSAAAAAHVSRIAGVGQLGCSAGLQGSAAAARAAARCRGSGTGSVCAPSAYLPQPPAPHAAAAMEDKVVGR